MSFEKLIKTYDREEALFYCDPPYYMTEKYYKNTGGFGEVEHRLLAETLRDIKGKFLISYNDCEFIPLIVIKGILKIMQILKEIGLPPPGVKICHQRKSKES